MSDSKDTMSVAELKRHVFTTLEPLFQKFGPTTSQIEVAADPEDPTAFTCSFEFRPVHPLRKPSGPYYPVAVDFDGTIVTHQYPEIGLPVPGAIEWMKKWVEAGARIILFTMRDGEELDQAVEYLRGHDVPLFGINDNPDQYAWTGSRKVYAKKYVDDAGHGCPLRDAVDGSRPHVDWAVIGPVVLQQIQAFMDR